MVDDSVNGLRSLRPSLSWSSYREPSPVRNNPDPSEQDQSNTHVHKNATRLSRDQEGRLGRTIPHDARPAQTHTSRAAKDPKSFHDADFFATHESLRRKRSSQQTILQNTEEPFIVRYQHYSSAMADEVAIPAQRTSLTPIDFIASRMVPRKSHKIQEATNKSTAKNNVQECDRDPEQVGCDLVNRVVSIVRELRPARGAGSSVADTRPHVTASHCAHTWPTSNPHDSPSTTSPISRNKMFGDLIRRLKNVQLRHAPSSGTLSSLGPLQDPVFASVVNTTAQQGNQEPMDEEYENDKLALFFSLNIARENKDANRRAADEKRLEHVIQLLDLLTKESDSCQMQKDRLHREKSKVEKRLLVRAEKLKYDKDLDADAQVAADGQDLQCRRPVGNATSSSKKTANCTWHAFNPVNTVTDVSYIERTGHVQLIGPKNYGGLATGILWVEGARHKHPRSHTIEPSRDSAGCVCKNHQCFEAITDDEYKYIGMARTKKERKWVIHLAKEKPNVGRWQIARKPVVEVEPLLETVLEMETESEPQRQPILKTRPSPPTRLLSGISFYEETPSETSTALA